MHTPETLVAGAAWRAFERLTQLSFPKSYPIVQFPNAPLINAAPGWWWADPAR